jgi:O-antigen/teichoic acid export membrane protein
VVAVLYTAFTLINHVYQHGMESAYLKYASGAEGRARAAEVFNAATWSVLAASCLLSAAMLLFRDPLSAFIGLDPGRSYLFFYAAGIQTLETLTIVPFAELRLQNDPLRFARLKMINIGLNVGLNLLFIIGLRHDIDAVFLSNLLASAVTFVMVLPLFAGRFGFRPSPVLWRQLLRFGLPFVPSGLSYALVDRVNVIFVGRMDAGRIRELYGQTFDLTALTTNPATTDADYGQYMAGIFGAVWKLGVFMMLVAQMFRFAWQPFFLQHAGDSDARPLYARIFSLFTALSLFVVLAVTFLIDDLVALPMPGGRTFFPPSYWPAVYIVPIALLAYLFQGWYYNFTAGAYIERKTSYFVYCTFAGGLITLAANALLVPTYGMAAAAWSTAAAYAVMALLLLFFVQRFYPIPYEWSRVAAMTACALGLYGAWRGFPFLQHWWAETALLASFLAGLFGLKILSYRALRQLFRGA